MGSSQPARLTDVAGTTAFARRKSLLLALSDRNILPGAEIVSILMAAAAIHHRAAASDDRAEPRAAVAALIDGILAGGDSVQGQ